APASANILAKLAHGLADDMLSTCLLAIPPATPLLVAPAMNTVMWEHPATVANLATLRGRGVEVVEPAAGVLACQDVGAGKLAAADDIVAAVIARLLPPQDLAGLHVVVTAGATREPLDPVRFLTNRSSGRMGYAIADVAARRGARVTLVSGHVSIGPPPGATVVPVDTAAEMLAACLDLRDAFDVFIAAAAVADYTPEQVAPAKIKRTAAEAAAAPDGGILTLRLRPTQDIVATIGAGKRPGQTVVAFAAETEALAANARRKLISKCADLVAANDVTARGAGFDVETNIVTLVTHDGERALPLLPKRAVAARLLDEIVRLRESPSALPASEARP
ncbi:MAG TPA: bifunctional phosphopantothenoylcysteine decarboxylase/phosphopantothenate--cysteine ligase CoaBC, partial [Chthonomonadaceae bacterium]|nr:bifunctional phosphopantothenoylcysteine decarboxylase/phosphopantothenate--cysteine ligase CoaBC [Chthonomonadaceae bacterium]